MSNPLPWFRRYMLLPSKQEVGVVLPIIIPCICAGIMACVGLYRMNVKGEEVSWKKRSNREPWTEYVNAPGNGKIWFDVRNKETVNTAHTMPQLCLCSRSTTGL